jgi:hypothetical protein
MLTGLNGIILHPPPSCALNFFELNSSVVIGTLSLCDKNDVCGFLEIATGTLVLLRPADRPTDRKSY